MHGEDAADHPACRCCCELLQEPAGHAVHGCYAALHLVPSLLGIAHHTPPLEHPAAAFQHCYCWLLLQRMWQRTACCCSRVMLGLCDLGACKLVLQLREPLGLLLLRLKLRIYDDVLGAKGCTCAPAQAYADTTASSCMAGRCRFGGFFLR
jgi:hypothetical protein